MDSPKFCLRNGISLTVACLLCLLTLGESMADTSLPPRPTVHKLSPEECLKLTRKADGSDLLVHLYRQGDRTPEESRKARVRVSFPEKWMTFPFPDSKDGDFKYLVVIGSEQTSEELRQLMGPVVLVGVRKSDSGKRVSQMSSTQSGEGADGHSFRFSIERLSNPAAGYLFRDHSMRERTLDSLQDAIGQPVPDASYLLQLTIGTDVFLVGPLSPQPPFRSMQPVVFGPEGVAINWIAMFSHPDYGIAEGGFIPPSNLVDASFKIPLVKKGSDAYEYAVRGTLRDPSGNPVPYARLWEDSSALSPARHEDSSNSYRMTVWTDSQGCFTYYPPRKSDPRRGIPRYFPSRTPVIFRIENPLASDWFPVLETDNAASKDLKVETAFSRRSQVLNSSDQPTSQEKVSIASPSSERVSPPVISGSPAVVSVTPSPSRTMPSRSIPSAGVSGPSTQNSPPDIEFQVLDYASDEPVSNSLVVFCEKNNGSEIQVDRYWKNARKEWLEYGAPIRNKLADAVMRKVVSYPRRIDPEVMRPDKKGRFHLKTPVLSDRGTLNKFCIAVFHREFLISVFPAEAVIPPAIANPKQNRLYLSREATGYFRIEGGDSRLTRLVGSLDIGESSQDYSGRWKPAGEQALEKIERLRLGLSTSRVLKLSFDLATSGTQEFRFPYPAGVYSWLRLYVKSPDNEGLCKWLPEKLNGLPTSPGGHCDFGVLKMAPQVIQKVYFQVQGPSGKPIPDVLVEIQRGVGDEERPPVIAFQESLTDSSGIASFEVLGAGAFQMPGRIVRPASVLAGERIAIQEFVFDWDKERSDRKEPRILKLNHEELQKLEKLIPVEKYR